MTKKRSAADRLFIGVFPTGISYADKSREENGDYKKLAYLNYRSLQLQFYGRVPPELRVEIEKHAQEIQARSGQRYPIDSSGHTVILGMEENNMNASRGEPADQHAADELLLYIDNTSDLSLQGPSGQGRSVALNALRKWKKGTYDPKLAVKLFAYLIESGAKRYAKEFGSGPWNQMFTPATRRLAAEQMEEEFRNQVENGEFNHLLEATLNERASARESGEITARTVLDELGRTLEHAGKDAPREAARIARLINKSGYNSGLAEKTLEEINKILDGHGVEAIRDENAYDGYFGDAIAEYVNMGDTYDATVVFDIRNRTWHVTSWGDWYEAYEQNRDSEGEIEERRGVREDDDDPDYWVQGLYSDGTISTSRGFHDEQKAVASAQRMLTAGWFEGETTRVITRDGELIWDSQQERRGVPSGARETRSGAMRETTTIPKHLVERKYHHEGWIENLDEYKSESVLSPEGQKKAERLFGSEWKNMKPSSVLRSITSGRRGVHEVHARDTRPRLDSFTRAYIDAMLWSSSDESDERGGEPLDKNYSASDIAPGTMARIQQDCADFQNRFGELIDDSEQAGHDFWLTRNRHGTGFWDRGLPKDVGDKLTEAAHEYGEVDPYVGDDGRIHISGGGHEANETGRVLEEARERRLTYQQALSYYERTGKVASGWVLTNQGIRPDPRKVHDYEVIDRRDRRIGGPYKSQSDARAKAGPGDVVRFVPAKSPREAQEMREIGQEVWRGTGKDGEEFYVVERFSMGRKIGYAVFRADGSLRGTAGTLTHAKGMIGARPFDPAPRVGKTKKRAKRRVAKKRAKRR